jgi:hypothetical protein
LTGNFSGLSFAARASFILPGTHTPLSEKEVITRCLAGKYDRKTRVKRSTDGIFTRDKLLVDYPQFLEAIGLFEEAVDAETGRREKAEGERQKKHEAQFAPHIGTPLLVLDGDENIVGEFLPNQVRYMFLTGRLSNTACFKHPEYDDRFPCTSLFNDERPNDFFFKEEQSDESLINEIRALRLAVKSVEDECTKIKWATRATGLFVTILFFYGVQIYFK